MGDFRWKNNLLDEVAVGSECTHTLIRYAGF